METLETELARARELDVSTLADAIEHIGFECTRCGACCKSDEADPHTATVFPDEVRELQDRDKQDSDKQNSGNQDSDKRDWREVARPMPYGLTEDGSGETFEWAIQTDACGDCTFYAEDDNGTGTCTVHDTRPLICETYPFSVALGGTSQPMGEAVDEAGIVRAHECEGLGRDISRGDAEELAATLKVRAVTELEEAVAVRDNFDAVNRGPEETVIHDSEGAKRPDGTTYSE